MSLEEGFGIQHFRAGGAVHPVEVD